MKLFLYPDAPPHLHDSIPEFRDTVPFSQDGIKKHCELTADPDEAEILYMGQHKDAEAWKLDPNRFEHFKGREARHAVDLEGDWRDSDHPEWLSESIVTTGHVRIESERKFRRRFARPVMSPLLVRLIRGGGPAPEPEIDGFWFRGQRDIAGLRERLRQGLELTGVPHEWEFTQGWGVYLPEGDQQVKTYLEKMRRWTFALCPIGEGPSCRFYEACAAGRLPVLMGDYRVCGEDDDELPESFPPRILAKSSPVAIAARIEAIYFEHFTWWGAFWNDRAVVEYYVDNVLKRYFADPTAWLLEQIERREAHAGQT